MKNKKPRNVFPSTSIVSKAVRDNAQRVIIKDGKITVISKSGKKKVGSFDIEITKWAELEKSFGNPNYNKKQYISELNKQSIPDNYSGELEGSPFISRIEDAQISAINRAIERLSQSEWLSVEMVKN